MKLKKFILVLVLVLIVIAPAYAFQIKLTNDSDAKLNYEFIRRSGKPMSLAAGELRAGQGRKIEYDYHTGVYSFEWFTKTNSRPYVLIIPQVGFLIITANSISFAAGV